MIFNSFEVNYKGLEYNWLRYSRCNQNKSINKFNMNKKLLKITLGLAALTLGFSANAQTCPTIPNCLGDTTITALAGNCDAIFDYNAPMGIDICSDAILFVSDNAAATEIPAVLTAAGYTVTTVYNDYSAGGNATLQAGNLANYTTIYWHAVGTGGGGTHDLATFTNLGTYINNGGNVFVTGLLRVVT